MEMSPLRKRGKYGKRRLPTIYESIDRQNQNPERWLIRQTHNERQGNIQPRNIPIVKMADPQRAHF
jgi:hypothetical protein